MRLNDILLDSSTSFHSAQNDSLKRKLHLECVTLSVAYAESKSLYNDQKINLSRVRRVLLFLSVLGNYYTPNDRGD